MLKNNVIQSQYNQSYRQEIKKLFQLIGDETNSYSSKEPTSIKERDSQNRHFLFELIDDENSSFQITFNEDNCQKTNREEDEIKLIGKIITGIDYCSSQVAKPFFQRSMFAQVDEEPHSVETCEYEEEEAIEHLKYLIYNSNGDEKIPEISKITLQKVESYKLNLPEFGAQKLQLSQGEINFIESNKIDETQKQRGAEFLINWIHKEAENADIALISIGSHGNLQQQNPNFAQEALAQKMTVKILNVDPLFKENKIGTDGVSFLRSKISREFSGIIYNKIKLLIAKNCQDSEKMVVVATYCHSTSHQDLQEIAIANNNQENLILLQGYSDDNATIILDKKLVANDCYLNEAKLPHEKALHFNGNKAEFDCENFAKLLGGKTKVFFRLENLQISHLKEAANQENPKLPSSSPANANATKSKEFKPCIIS